MVLGYWASQQSTEFNNLNLGTTFSSKLVPVITLTE